MNDKTLKNYIVLCLIIITLFSFLIYTSNDHTPHKQFINVVKNKNVNLPIMTREDTSLTYTFSFDYAGGVYRVLDSSLAVLYSHASSSTAWTNLMGRLTSGNTVNVVAGSYTVDAAWIMDTITNVTVTFDSAATLTAVNGLNSEPLKLTGCTSCIVNGGTFDGNAANQTLAAGIDDAGILLESCVDCWVYNVHITNVRRFGFFAVGPDISNCGITNSIIEYCWWNGMNLGGSIGTETTLYAYNNDVSHCSDVGITGYATDISVCGNVVHDMEQLGSLDSHPGEGAQWGIAVEHGGGSGGGTYSLIAKNTVSGCNNAVVLLGDMAVDNIIVSGNLLYPASDGNGVTLYDASNCIVASNTVNNAYHGTILLNAACIDNNVCGTGGNANIYVGCTINVKDDGTDTVTTAPSIVVVTFNSSPLGVGYVSVAGTAKNTPYTTYYTVDDSVDLIANTPVGYVFDSWSDSGAETHSINVPAVNTVYTAVYTPTGIVGSVNPVYSSYYLGLE